VPSATSSSTSSSEWRRFLATLAAAAAGALALAWGFLIVADPFDTGRLTPVSSHGLPATGQRLAVASLGRDPAFDAAIVGNSTIQLVSPERLAAITGRRFVQLSIPGTGPVEQLHVLDWFRRSHGAGARAVVLGFDAAWCGFRGPLGRDRVGHPFPFWLISRSTPEYLRNLLAFEHFEAATKRLNVLLGQAPRHRPDGYDDYEAERPYDPADARMRLDERYAPAAAEPGEPVHPAMTTLAEELNAFPPGSAKVLVLPPTYRHPAAVQPAETECEREARWIAARVVGAAVVKPDDWPALADPDSFRDPIHYRRPIAEALERRIAEAVSRAGAR
jgi:hypothetical protein